MNAKELPTLDSEEKSIRQHSVSTSIQPLTDDEIEQELDHWQRQLTARHRLEMDKRANPGLKSYVVGWGVLAIEAAGVVVAYYLDSIIGFCIAISGFVLSGYECYVNWQETEREKTLDERARLAHKRREGLIQESERRFSLKPIPIPIPAKLPTP